MFEPDLWQSHDEYRTIIHTYGRRLSRNGPKYSVPLYDKERQKLLNLNLDAILEYILPIPGHLWPPLFWPGCRMGMGQ